MAKTPKTNTPQSARLAPAGNDVAAPNAPAPCATPENTPVPGGGRWRWDINLPGWVEVPEAD